MIYFENVDGRVCILFPYLGKVLLGSTDIRVDEPGDVRCEDDEVDYILQVARPTSSPASPCAPEEIVYRYSGVRPLPRSDASFTGRISRDHFVARDRRHAADALPRRRQVDDLPRLRRAGRRPGARHPRASRARSAPRTAGSAAGVGFPDRRGRAGGAGRRPRRRVRRVRERAAHAVSPLRHAMPAACWPSAATAPDAPLAGYRLYRGASSAT